MRLIRSYHGSLVNPAFIEEILGWCNDKGQHVIYAYFASGRVRTLAAPETAEAMASQMDALRRFMEAGGAETGGAPSPDGPKSPEAAPAVPDLAAKPKPEGAVCGACGHDKEAGASGRVFCRHCAKQKALRMVETKARRRQANLAAEAEAVTQAEAAAAGTAADIFNADVSFAPGLALTGRQRDFIRGVCVKRGDGDFVVTTHSRNGMEFLRFGSPETVDRFAEPLCLVRKDGDAWRVCPAPESPK